MNATANTVSNKPVITIQEPGAKATNAQLRVIGHAVKENQLNRFDENAWKNMTKNKKWRLEIFIFPAILKRILGLKTSEFRREIKF